MAATSDFVKNDKRIITGWAFFDWANSSYALVITAAIFPGYYLGVTDSQVRVLGMDVDHSTLYAWSLSFAYLIIACISPFLSGIADYSGRKKTFLRLFTVLGSLSCMSLYFFTGMSTLWLGTWGFILATIGFAGGIVFYNAFLPVIATEDRYDDVSAKGFSYGFIGSMILLAFNLVTILNYQAFGFSEKTGAVRMSFVLVGLWWLGFSQIPLRRLPEDKAQGKDPRILRRGYLELKKVGRVLRKDQNTLTFLLSFFMYNAGVQALLYLASAFAETVLHFDTTGLIGLIIVLQVLAILGAWLLAKLSDKRGNRFALMAALLLWVVICALGYSVRNGMEFYLLAGIVGLAMGGTQSLSRSTYAKFLPENTLDTASYFSFYDVVDKVSTVAGTFIFGIVGQITGSMRSGVLAMLFFFVLGALLLAMVRVRRMRQAAPSTTP